MTSNRPTPEQSARHEITEPQVDATANRPAWQIVTQLDRLYAEKLIGLGALFAARSWRRDWETANGRSRGSKFETASRSSSGSGSLPHLAAATRLRAVDATLGRSTSALLKAVLIDELPWTRLGKMLGCSDRAAKTRAAVVIGELADLIWLENGPRTPVRPL